MVPGFPPIVCSPHCVAHGSTSSTGSNVNGNGNGNGGGIGGGCDADGGMEDVVRGSPSDVASPVGSATAPERLPSHANVCVPTVVEPAVENQIENQ